MDHRRNKWPRSSSVALFLHANVAGISTQRKEKILLHIPARFKVLFYPTVTKRCKGLNNFISTDHEAAVGHTRNGRIILRSTCVKPDVHPGPINDDADVDTDHPTNTRADPDATAHAATATTVIG